MSPPVTGPTDDELEREVGRLLLIGVLIAGGVVLMGGVAYLARHGRLPRMTGAFAGEPVELRSLRGIVQGVAASDSRAVIQLGVVLLIGTPIARVALTLLAFARQRDRLYTGITALVLGLLLFSLLHGRA